MNLQVAARRAAQKYGIPVRLFYALVRWESGWKPDVVSPAGAVGLTQLMPGTARGLGVDPHDPVANLNGGAHYLRQAFDHFGSWKLALAAYNAGWGAVSKYGGIPPYAETQKYVKGILGIAGSVPHLQQVAKHVGLDAHHALLTSTPKPLDMSSLAFDNLSHIAAGTYTPEGSLEALSQAVALRGPTSTPTPISSPGLPPSAAGASRIDKAVVQDTLHFLGTPYVWGGESPSGFDCSGLLQYVWGKRGVKIPRTTYDQWTAGSAVHGKLRPGDAVFFRGSDARGNLPGHVGIFIGGGRFIEAPHTGSTVRVSRLKGRSDYVGARRFA